MGAAASPVLHYGDHRLDDVFPRRVLDEGRIVPLRLPRGVPEVSDVDGALRRALEVSDTPDLTPPIGEWLADRYHGGDVTIVVDDATRPCAHQRRLLPGLLKWLESRGVHRGRIGIVVAVATHRPARPEEYPWIVGEAVARAWGDRIISHDDQRDLARLGTMPDGVPVELNRRAAESELLIGLSDLDYHYFAGVTGGPKQLVPGIAGRALTTADHLRMFGPLGFAPNVDMGILDGNPVYEYKRAAVKVVLDAMRARRSLVVGVIAVLDPAQRIVALAGGDVIEVHRRLRSVLDRVYAADLPEPADVAIVSARHHGINVYQAGKAINTAARAVRSGGTVACLAPCREGFGNEEFRALMGTAAPILEEADGTDVDGERRDEVRSAAIDRALLAVQDAVVRDFRIGKQKPIDLLLQLRRLGWGHLFLMCDGLSEEDRRLLPFRYIDGPGEAPRDRLGAWIRDQERSGSPRYAVIDDPAIWIRGAAR